MTMPATFRSRLCPVCLRPERRTNEANKRLWAIYTALADGYAYEGRKFSADSYHLECRKRFLGCTDHVLPTGEVMTIPNSTSNLSPEEFAEYMGRVEALAASHEIYLDE